MKRELQGDTLVVRIPMRFKRQGGRKRILAPDGSDLAPPTRAQPDGTLVKALARAWRWQRQLDTGVYASLAQIAAAEKLSPSYVSRVARLAPDIIEAILAGTLNQSVILERLEKGVPAEWESDLCQFRVQLDSSGRRIISSARRSRFPLACRWGDTYHKIENVIAPCLEALGEEVTRPRFTASAAAAWHPSRTASFAATSATVVAIAAATSPTRRDAASLRR